MPIKITRPTMPLLDVNKLPVPGVTNSMSVEEAMEKASFLPDGTYYLQFEARLDVTGNPVAEEPEPEPTPEPEPDSGIPIGIVSALQTMGLLPVYESVGTRSVDTNIDWTGGTGERGEIGLFPEDHAAFIAGQVDLKDGILEVALNPPPSGMDHAHKPNLYWLPYLLTGDVRYVRNMEETWRQYKDWRNLSYDASFNDWDYGRQMAWSLRDLAQLAYLQKLGVTEHDYYLPALQNTLDYYTSLTTKAPFAEWSVLGFRPHVESGWCGWQESFVGQALAHTVRLGFAEWKPIAEFQYQNLVKRSGTEWPFKAVDNDHVAFYSQGQTRQSATWENIQAYTNPGSDYLAYPDDALIPTGNVLDGKVYTYPNRAQYAYGHAALAASIGIEGASEKRDQIYTAIKGRGDSWDTKNHYAGGVIATPPVVVEPTPEDPPIVIEPGEEWAGWDDLPANKFVNLNINPSVQITDQLIAAGFGLNKMIGNSKVKGTFIAWVGGVLVGDRFYIKDGGGHGDSAINGTWYLDLATMQMGIEQMPSDPFDPVAPWSQEYIDSKNYTMYPGADSPRDILPDGRATARHTYGANWYSSQDNTLNTGRVSQWIYDLETKENARILFSKNGVTVQADSMSYLFYDDVKNVVYGSLRETAQDYWDWEKIDSTGVITDMPMPNGAHSAMFCQKDRDIYVFGSSGSKPEYAQKFNMDTEKWTVLGNTGLADYPYNVDMSGCVWVPEWNKFLRQFSGTQYARKWFVTDPDTGVTTPYTPAGANPYENLIGSKVFYYPAKKAVIYLASGSVHVMRVE